MKLILLTTSLIIAGSLSAFAQQKDTLYFNIDGRDTTASHASYYRVRTRQGAGWQVTDYSLNRKPQMTGAFSDDSCKVRQGKWIGYYRTGQVAGDVVYENGKQVSGTFFNDDGSKNKKVKEFIRESDYPGGAAQWLRFLNKTLKYPDNAWKNKIEGIVVVQFVVDEDGNPTDIKVIKSSANAELDAEAKRVISESKDWVPAVYGGRFVKSYKKQPIVFKLQNS
jgi:TonB family protein